MKYCKNCLQTFDSNSDYCSICGNPLQAYTVTQNSVNGKTPFCRNCGAKKTDSNALFCANCGKSFSNNAIFFQEDNVKKPENSSLKQDRTFEDAKKNLLNSEFAKLAKGQVENIGRKTKEWSKNKKKVVILLLHIVLLAVILFSNINECEDCGKTYVGRENLAIFAGDKHFVCENCYDYYLY